MGEYPAAVRAMCALTNAEVKKKLGFAVSHPVEFRLIVGGTGVGQAGPAGSSSSNFKNLYATADPRYDEIFADHALRGKFDINEVRRVLEIPHNKVPREVILSNARMAAAYGDEVYRTLSQVLVTDRYTFLAKMDLLACLTPAAFQYRRRNGLEFLSLDELSGLAIRSVRMNMFPTAETFEKTFMQYKYGLVVDTSRYAKGRSQAGDVDLGLCGPSDTHRQFISSYSQYEIPAFAMVAVAAMTNLSCVTKSLVNGSSLVAYWHGASYLLACASGSGELLHKLFQDAHSRKGSVEPLNYTSVKGKDGCIVVCDPLNGRSLPTEEAVVVSTEADYSNREMTDAEYATYLKAVQNELEKQKAKMTEATKRYGSGVRICPIVSIRSPDKFKFADSITLIDNALFLFQMKDMRRFISQDDVEKGLWEMGDEVVMEKRKTELVALKTTDARKDIQDNVGPSELVREVQRLWRTMIVKGNVKVYRCFVTSSPAPTKSTTRKGKEREYGGALLLNVESIKFLKFDNTRPAPAVEEQHDVVKLT